MENADIKEIEQFLKCSLEEDGEKLKIKKRNKTEGYFRRIG